MRIPPFKSEAEENEPDLPWFRSTPSQLAFVYLMSILILLQYGIDKQAIQHDCAYLMYMGQVVFRGDALYSSTTFGYTPYGPMLSAFTMHIGQLFGFKTYLAPRYFSLIVAALNSCLLYLIARNISRSSRMGIFAGLTLSGFGYLAILSISSLEPKLMVVTCMLLAMHALQQHRWLVAGAASAAAAMFWQPALIITPAIATMLILFDSAALLKRLARFCAGYFLGLLPAIIYLTSTQDWSNFYFQAIVRKALTDLPNAADAPISWLGDALTIYYTEVFVFVFALAGFIYCIIRLLILSKASRNELLINGGYGAVILLTLLWSLFNSIEFDGGQDLVPILPLLAFWFAYLLDELLRRGRHIAPRYAKAKKAVTAAVLTLVGGYLYFDAMSYKPTYTLSAQYETLNNCIDSANPPPRFLSFNAEEFYVLTEQRAPLRYTQLGRWIELLIDHYEPGKIDGFLASLKRELPPIVIIRHKKDSAVQDSIESFLADYTKSSIVAPGLYKGYSLYRK